MRPLLLLAIAACETAAPAEPIALALPQAAEPAAAVESTSTVKDPEVESIDPLVIEQDFAERPPAAARVGLDLVGLRTPVKRWFLAMSPHNRHIVRATCRLRRDSPCWQMMNMKKNDEFFATDDSDRFNPFGQSDAMDEFCSRTTGDGNCATPLVVAFDDEPVAYTPATHRFAFRGAPLATDWPTANTPWIALDRDGDGAITSGFELFGDATAKNGFAALAALDANSDGVIDRDDPEFANLVLWADANADRKSSPDELRPLASAVVAIPLAHRMDPQCVNGNCEGERGVIQLLGGRTGAVIDIYLAER